MKYVGSSVIYHFQNTEEQETYEKFLQVCLEIVNSCLTYALPKNIWLIYELLHQKTILEPLKNVELFSDLVSNLDMIVQFFDARVNEAEKEEGSSWSLEEIMEIIQNSFPLWTGDKIKVFDHYKYTYTEDGTTEEFFYPYIWANIVTAKHPCTIWDIHSIVLSLPIKELEEEISQENINDDEIV